MSRRIATLFAGLALALSTLLILPVTGQEKKPQNVDLVLCIDTSNSMDGLIEAAKNRLWDIVNDLAKVKPAPNLRVALYSYGNDGYDASKGWVRKEMDFNNDLDLVFKKLFDLKTNGGTEYVGRVCNDAILQQKWSEDKNALKLIFVCGNEGARQDPQITLEKLAELALSKDIIVNPIYCGNADDGDARGWRELSSLAKGKFANIDQNRQQVAVATPFDKELAELAGKINNTYLSFTVEGRERLDNQKEQTKNSLKLGESNAAGRVAVQSSALYRQASWDLVDKLREDPKFDITKVPEAQLCETLKKLKPEERIKYVQEKAKERETIQKRVQELNQKRGDFLRDESKKDPSRDTFGATLRKTIREQAEKKGIAIPE